MSKNTELNKLRQAYMKSLGYNVPTDGSWGPYQLKIWDKLSTKLKLYDTTFTGFAAGLWDKLTGNSTYKKDPLTKNLIYKSKEDSYTKPSNGVSKALLGTYLPGMAVLSAPYALAVAPAAAITGFVGGIIGNGLVNMGSRLINNKDFSTNVGNALNISKEASEYLNPGSYIGGYGAVRRMLNSIYANVAPLGYNNIPTRGGVPISTITKKGELLNSIKDYFTPKKINTNNPKWKNSINEGTIGKSTIIFRDDAWRLAMRKKPRSIMIDGKPEQLYIANGDGTYSYNFKYINYVKRMCGEPEYNFLRVNFEHPNIAHDNITSNAGFLNVKYTPEYTLPKDNYVDLGKPKVIIEDVWDLLPFKDTLRTLFPKLTLFAKKHPNFITNYFKNLEVLRAVGGKPFILRLEIPEGTVQLKLVKNKLPQ